MFFGILLLNILLLVGTFCNGQKSANYCSVCRVIVSEAEWLVSQVDPKKSIQVGSFRVDPKGNQKVKDKQYARSEVHIEEVIESICENMRLYSEITLDDGSTQMVRTLGFNGRRLQTKDLTLDEGKGTTFKYQCENFLEDHEEEIISQLQLENIPNYEKLICGEKLGVCSMEVLATPMFTLPEAVDDAIEIGEAGNKEPAEDSTKINNDDNSDGGKDDDSGNDDESEHTVSDADKTEL